MPDKPFFIYFAPGATHAPHHVPPEWSDKYTGQFDARLGRAARGDVRAARRSSASIPADAELTARPDEIPAWDDMPDDAQAGARPPDGGLRRLPGAHRPPRRPARRRARGPRSVLDDTLVYYIIGDNGALGRGHRERHVQRDGQLQRRRRARDAGVHGVARSTSSARPTPTTTTRSAGRTRWTRRTSGPSRSPRTGAAPATARSCTGPPASRPRARCAPSSTTSSTSRRRSSRPPGSRSRRSSTASSRRRSRASSMLYTFDDADAAERHDPQYFEMFGNRGIYHKGWTAVTRHSTPWLPNEELPAFDDDVWELYDGTERLDPGARPRRRAARQARRAAAPVADRGGEVQRAAARRPPVRALQLRPRRPPAADPRHHAAALRRHGAAHARTPSSTSRTSRSRVTAEIDDPRGRRATACIIAQGGRVRRLGLYVQDGRAEVRLQPARHPASSSRRRDRARSRRATHQVRIEFAYDGGGLGKGGDVTLYLDGARGRHRPRRARPSR